MMAAIDAGEIILKAKYWSGRLDTVSVRDKATGGRRTSYAVRETVLTAIDPIMVGRWLRDDEDSTKWKPSAKQGETVVVRIKKMKVELGVIQLEGMIEALV